MGRYTPVVLRKSAQPLENKRLTLLLCCELFWSREDMRRTFRGRQCEPKRVRESRKYYFNIERKSEDSKRLRSADHEHKIRNCLTCCDPSESKIIVPPYREVRGRTAQRVYIKHKTLRLLLLICGSALLRIGLGRFHRNNFIGATLVVTFRAFHRHTVLFDLENNFLSDR